MQPPGSSYSRGEEEEEEEAACLLRPGDAAHTGGAAEADCWHSDRDQTTPFPSAFITPKAPRCWPPQHPLYLSVNKNSVAAIVTQAINLHIDIKFIDGAVSKLL